MSLGPNPDRENVLRSLRDARGMGERVMAVSQALAWGMPLHEIECYLDALDDERVRTQRVDPGAVRDCLPTSPRPPAAELPSSPKNQVRFE